MAGDDCFYMEHSKAFYEAVIHVIEYLNENNRKEISKRKGIEMAGDYWTEVGKLFKSNAQYCIFEHGDLSINNLEELLPLFNEYKHFVAEIEKAEYDRNLANEESISNIKYGIKGYDLAKKSSKWSKASIIISAIVAAGQLTQWILMLLQYLSQR